MGCDIHLYIEVRKDGKWTSADRWTRDTYAPPGVERMTVDYDHNWFTDRNYELFAILAGVRGEAAPIAEPKGFPEDASELLKIEYAEGGDHTPTWYTLRELMDADWEAPVTYQKVVEYGAYAKWNAWDRKQGESPSGWCGGTSVKTISEAEADVLVAKEVAAGKTIYDIGKRTADSFIGDLYVSATWQVPRYKVAERFLSRVVSRMFKLGKPEDVRVVFWFDN